MGSAFVETHCLHGRSVERSYSCSLAEALQGAVKASAEMRLSAGKKKLGNGDHREGGRRFRCRVARIEPLGYQINHLISRCFFARADNWDARVPVYTVDYADNVSQAGKCRAVIGLFTKLCELSLVEVLAPGRAADQKQSYRESLHTSMLTRFAGVPQGGAA